MRPSHGSFLSSGRKVKVPEKNFLHLDTIRISIFIEPGFQIIELLLMFGRILDLAQGAD
jgi:hypothetical protein